jgi:hypothetical protein
VNRAAVPCAPGDLRVEERDVPTPGPREGLAEIAAVGVCGSDVHYCGHGRRACTPVRLIDRWEICGGRSTIAATSRRNLPAALRWYGCQTCRRELGCGLDARDAAVYRRLAAPGSGHFDSLEPVSGDRVLGL